METINNEELWALYLSNGCNASALAPLMGVTPSTARRRLAQIRSEKGVIPNSILESEDPEYPNELAEALAKGNIPQETVSDGKIADLWIKTGTKKGFSARFKFKPKNDLEFPLIQPADPVTICYNSPPRILRKVRRVAIVSDAQIGFRRLANGDLNPTHDPKAIDVAMQVIQDFAPDELGSIGDWLDESMFSRWPKTPDMMMTTQESIYAGRDILANFISAAGPQLKKRIMVLGNHDDRFQNFLRDSNLEAMGLKTADDTTGWPVFSLAFMLGFNSLGVEVTDPYPHGLWWIASNLAAGHAPIKKLELQASYVHGHMHRITCDTWAQTGFDSRENYFMYDLGCVCKIDGTVPSNKPRTEWAQGIGLIEIIDGKIPKHQMYQVRIDQGEAIFAGKTYRA